MSQAKDTRDPKAAHLPYCFAFARESLRPTANPATLLVEIAVLTACPGYYA
jgi:hypothetical protein